MRGYVAKGLQSLGLELEYAQMLAALDTVVANSGENRLNDVVSSVTGQPPKLFKEFVEVNRNIWV